MMKSKNKFKCFLGLHEWDKYMGPQNHGDKLLQKYICLRCRKIKEVIQ